MSEERGHLATGLFCVIWGGLFTFPYLLYLIVQNKGDMRAVFLGSYL